MKAVGLWCVLAPACVQWPWVGHCVVILAALCLLVILIDGASRLEFRP